MKKLLLFIGILIGLSSCSATKEARSSRSELRNEKRFSNQEMIKVAVESRRFIIKFDRIYSYRGGFVDLVPKANYIIVNGNTTVISTAYIGRQFDIRPIAGITLRGEASKYIMSSNPEKGKYEIEMKVAKGGDSFDIFLTIGKDGSCSASLSSMRIDNVRYSGYIVPIIEKKINFPENRVVI